MAIEAEIEALSQRNVAHVYAPFEGHARAQAGGGAVRQAVHGPRRSVLRVASPSWAPWKAASPRWRWPGACAEGRRKVLCLEPGFPVNKLQLRFLGLEREWRSTSTTTAGTSCSDAVEARAERGDVCAILWSSPNNPSWITLNDSELKGLGRICDSTTGCSPSRTWPTSAWTCARTTTSPAEPPYQPTVLRYTKHGICLVSSSKIFSYAGQRIAHGHHLATAVRGRGRQELSESTTGTSNVGPCPAPRHPLSHRGLCARKPAVRPAGPAPGGQWW